MAIKLDLLHGFIRESAPNPSRIMTDEWQAYRGIADGDTTHETVEHGAKEYVRGDVHTNSVEGAFGLFKRAIVGSFHQISHKHLSKASTRADSSAVIVAGRAPRSPSR